MASQTVFKRYELKYLLTKAQKEVVLAAMTPYMRQDRYGRTTIRNIYYDTDTYLLIRRSIERPAYKEKLRIRSYAQAGPEDPVFVELKKKFDHIVYKRRIAASQGAAMAWVAGLQGFEKPSQIASEIDYFLKFYGTLHPVLFLTYEREAFYATDGSDFRVTFDDTILCREDNLSLDTQPDGIPILPQDRVLMEIKCSGGIPLWLTDVLSREKIYKTSFSKYGTAYQTIIYPQLRAVGSTLKEGNIYA